MNSSVDKEEITRQAGLEWEQSASLRFEFGRREAYVAWRVADARGRAHVVGAKCLTMGSKEPANTASFQHLSERQSIIQQQNSRRQIAGLPPLATTKH